MMRSLYAGVSGLQNHQIRTDVIGNNIANINTNGFKKGRVSFQDMISQTLEGASRPDMNLGKGGTNPKQVGLGMTVASIDQLMYQGSLQTTGKKTDMAVQGEGLFILRKGDQVFYTRSGNYGLDRNRNLVNPANGFKLQGWNSQQDTEGNFFIDNSGTYEDIVIPIGDKSEARSTREVVYKSNLDARVDSVENPFAPSEAEVRRGQVHRSSIDVYDSQGRAHKMEIRFVKVATNEWQAQVDIEDAVEGSVRFDVGQEGNVNQDTQNKEMIYLTFNNKGALTSMREAAENNPDAVAQGELTATVVFNIDDGTIQRGGIREGASLGYEQRVQVRFGTSENFDGVTQLSSANTTKGISQDGYGLGYLESYNIDQNGVITGIYTNGKVQEISQVSLASFINPNGLEKVGENQFILSNNSGIANVGSPSSQGKGKIVAGALEMSNVDLAEEFTNMIVTQRGFQANSRIITTSDQMLQELLTLKR